MRYKVGDKVVPQQGLEAAPDWFSDNYVVISRVGEFDYTVKPYNQNLKSWLADAEIDKQATDIVNSY